MDVRLPDGTIVRNVPDGMSKADLAAKLRTNGVNIPDEWMAEPPSTMDKIAQGAGNLAAGVASGFADVGDTILNAAAAPVGAVIPAVKQWNDERTANLEQFNKERSDSTAFNLGRVGGNVAATIPVGGVLGAGAKAAGAAPQVVKALTTSGMNAGGLTGATGAAVRAGAGAVTGGTAATLVNPEEAGAGVVTGAVAPGAMKLAGLAGNAVTGAVRGTVRGARAAVEPFTASGRQAIAGRVLARAAGDDVAAVVPRLAQAGELVPGSAPTAAQVSQNGGIAALERAMASRSPAPFADRAVEQTAARVRAVEEIAGDAGQKEFFSGAREAAAQELYEKAFAVPLTLEDLTPAMRGEVRKLMAIPAIKEAMKAARQNAQNHGMKLGAEGNVAGLHQAKLALDDQIQALSGATGAQANKARAIEAARDRLVTFIEKVSPDYAEARATYAAMSQPVNQMAVGQELLEKLQPALGEAGAVTRENGETFARALRDGDGLVKSATGRNMRFDDVMAPEQAATLRAVAEDLARKTNAADLARGPGSNTFQHLAMNNIAEQAGAPRVLGAVLNAPILTKVPRALYEGADEKIQAEIVRSLLEPHTAAQMLTQQIQRQALMSAPRRPMLSDPTRDAIELLFARAAPVAISSR